MVCPIQAFWFSNTTYTASIGRTLERDDPHQAPPFMTSCDVTTPVVLTSSEHRRRGLVRSYKEDSGGEWESKGCQPLCLLDQVLAGNMRAPKRFQIAMGFPEGGGVRDFPDCVRDFFGHFLSTRSKKPRRGRHQKIPVYVGKCRGAHQDLKEKIGEIRTALLTT